MDPRIKAGIFSGESGGDYNALFGWANRPGGAFASQPLTSMTIDQALQFASPSGPYAQQVKGKIGRVATPLGAYQVVGSTLKNAKKGLGLTGSEVMNQETQDKIGDWILANQGTGAWEGYRGPKDPGSLKTATQQAFKPSKSGGAALMAQAPTIGQTQGEAGIESGQSKDIGKESVSESLAKAYADQAERQKAASWEWIRQAMQPRQVTPYNGWGGQNG